MNKVAIVYWSATGNTEAMANCIAEGAGDAATVLTCAGVTPDVLAKYDVVAFGCPAMGAEQLEESEFEPMFSSVEGGAVRLLRLGRRPVDAGLVRPGQERRRRPVQRGGSDLQRRPRR